MRLLHLTAVGADVPAASVEFAPRLTVIYGASEAGKSYIIDALNFMLGARALRSIPEGIGYQTMLLGIDLNDGRSVTLARDLRGGRVSVFEDDLRELPKRAPDHSLSAQHVTGSEQTISHYLLNDLGLAGAQVRKNDRNQVQALGIRNLMHLCLVDEERILAKRSPVESGVPMARTADRSVFKLLLEGQDDSGLSSGEDPTQFRRINRGQVEVLDRALAQLHEHVSGSPERPSLLDQLARLNDSIAQNSRSVAAWLDARSTLVARRSELEQEALRHRNVVTDARALSARFGLLDRKYSSDLDRLGMVREVGTFLGYFQGGACVLCGASPEHQNAEHAVYESAEVSLSVDAEIEKTTTLRRDLSLTLGRINDEERRALASLREAQSASQAIDDQLAQLERDMRPDQEEASRLMETRSETERAIGIWDRIEELEALRASVAQERPQKTDEVAEGISSQSQREFSAIVARIVTEWGVPGADECSVSFDGAPDVVMQQRDRVDRGKGMRSILHAGFVVGLGEFCIERDRPHPGFLALDTPVLTYRDAEKREDAEPADELMTQSVARSMYAYLATSYPGQSIVLENQTPPSVEADGCSVYFFTGTPGVGRSGFFPQ
ncbi:MAG: hypothetical protein CMH83_02530 [Nocardioides sp.]|nr:hypothetical protein [Nocardioides sp.]